MEKMNGSAAIVTGASRGLGVHIAKAFAKKGINLVLAARSAGLLEDVRERVQSTKADVAVIPTDLTDRVQITELAKQAEEEIGPIDILVNNAGVELTTPYEEYPPEKIRLAAEVNLLAPMLLTRAVLPGMLKRGRGHIVNISSLAGKVGFPYQTPYAATKAGVVMFTHSLRAELMDKPVGVSVICPGYVADSGMYARKQKSDIPAPKTLKPTTPDKVVAAVFKAIKKNIPEITVNSLPVRPLTILRETFPGIIPFIHKATGNTQFIRELSGIQSDEKTG